MYIDNVASIHNFMSIFKYYAIIRFDLCIYLYIYSAVLTFIGTPG